MTERMSGGEVAHIVGGLMDGEKNPEGALQLMGEIRRRLQRNEPLESHLEAYLGWAIKRLQVHGDANRAFGLARPEHRPTTHADRDERIAFLVQCRASSGKYTSIDAAAMAVRDYLAECDPPINLAWNTIKNIYIDHREDPFVQAAAKLYR